jgi:hypothetical protein
MSLPLAEARAQITALVRTIDRKADLDVALQEGDRPAVVANISLRKNKTTVVIPIRDLENAKDDSIQRSNLRQTLKRAIDKMSFTVIPYASTKLTRGPVVDGGFFRSQQGGGQRGGRR